MTDDVFPVVMGGGAGTRLWPLSRPFWPKQFLTLGRGDQSLLQSAVGRARRIAPGADPMAVVSEDLLFVVQRQMAESNYDVDVLAESRGRGTAAVAALASLKVAEVNPDGVVVLIPADHIVDDEDAMAAAVRRAIALARDGYLALIGIEPDRPETGYGYLRVGDRLESGFEVAEFVEKPGPDDARRYQTSGEYLWNAGLHLFKASRMMEELSLQAPDILQGVRQAWGDRGRRGSVSVMTGDAWQSVPDLSVDVAVLEKASRVAAVPYAGGWSDLGGYEALWLHGDKDDAGNVAQGRVLAVDADNNYLHAARRTLVALGVENLAVVSDDDYVLVADRAHLGEIPRVIAELRERQWEDPDMPVRVHRPWGWYESVLRRPGYQLKRICLWPGQAISLQRHAHRSEHWVITKGEAELTLGEKVSRVAADDYAFIPATEIHRLRNVGAEPVEWVEVQTGTYFGEDDIERLDDIYGRAGDEH